MPGVVADHDREEVTVWPPTEIDLSTVGSLHHYLQEACATGFERVVVDVSLVTFCDCQGVRVLVEVAEALRQRGCVLEIRGVTPMLMRLATLTRSAHALNLAAPD
jgi:anti-anti-sigma factor